MVFPCDTPVKSRQRHFWTTQPVACGTVPATGPGCGNECNIPGLQLDKQEIYVTGNRGASFATNDWVRSLLLNIFSTEARKFPSDCGNVPGQQGGHWSESYGDGTYIGTKMYSNNKNLVVRNTSEAVKLFVAAVQVDAYKLVTYGVANAVNVKGTYLGNMRVMIDIEVIGPTVTDGRVNLKAQRINNQWVWES
jgi:hypothetical protein